MLQTSPSPRPAESREAWPEPAVDRPRKAEAVKTAVASSGEEKKEDKPEQEEPGLQDLRIPRNERALRRLIHEQETKLTSIGQAYREVAFYNDGASRKNYRQNHATSCDALGAGAFMGVVVGLPAFIITLPFGHLQGALAAGGGLCALSIAAGLVSAAVILVKDLVSLSRKNARYYSRAIMFRATDSGLDENQQRELVEMSKGTLQKERESLSESIEKLSDALEQNYGDSIRRRKERKYQKAVDEIKKVVD